MRNILLLGAGLVFLVNLQRAGSQEMLPQIHYAFSDINVSLESAGDVDTMLEAVTNTAPVSFNTFTNSPRQQTTGTFWSMQNPNWPPLPGDVLESDVWEISAGKFIIDDRDVDYAALQAASEVALSPVATPMMRMSMMASSLSTTYAYGNAVYLANMAASFTNDGSITASFSIAGGTNFVPYDILMSTNVAAPISSWNWIGIGYTSNNYVFHEQPSDNAFYILAKPSKTMTVGFGDDTIGQCDVPFGLTNALQVAAGRGQSLALRNDGTVIAWGANFYGQATVPTNLAGVAMISAGWYHSLAMLTNGTVVAWGISSSPLFGGLNVTNVPANLTNAIVISAQALHSLALRSDGTVVSWGYNGAGETNVPSGLSNVVAIAAGGEHSLAVTTNGSGTVVAWGDNSSGQCTVPTGLSNVVDVAAGPYHSLALLKNGTIVAWGDDLDDEIDVPAGLTNVVAIAASGDADLDVAYSMALKCDGTVVVWGDDNPVDPVGGLNNVISIAGGNYHALAVLTGPRTPVITLEPVSQYQIAGSTATFTGRGAGLYGVTYQWQVNGVNLTDATNTALNVTNVQATTPTNYDVVVTDNGGMGSLTSSVATLYVVTPPVITYRSAPTNIVCIYGNVLSFAAMATAPYQTNGFPLHYQWQFNGTNISGANSTNYTFTANDNSSGVYSLVVTNAAGSTNAAWQVTVTNINVTNDLLLIYNSNSADSSNLCYYYLAHRPMVGGANVLGVATDTNEITPFTNYISQIETPVFNWLTNNPSKRPQYVILFYGIPTRLQSYPAGYGSVSYNLHNDYPNWQPFVNNLTASNLVDCEAYVDKIAAFGSNYSPGQLIISASAGGYANTNFVLDNVRHGAGSGDPGDYTYFGGVLSPAIPAITNANPSVGVTYIDGVESTNTVLYLPHITNAVNVAGYMCWGGHSNWGTTNMNDGDFPLDGNTKWSGSSGWWLIETIESFNGQRGIGSGQSNFEKWFSSTAFGGTNYSNTPVGVVSSVEEPFAIGVCYPPTYFGLWAAGKNFAICAWNSLNVPAVCQIIGDPFVTR